MIKDLTIWMKKKKNFDKVKIFAGLLIALSLFGDKIQIGSQSALGLLGGLLSLSVILFIFGVILIVIPEPTTTLTGIILVGVSILLTGGTFFAFFSSLPTLFGFPIWSLVILIIIGYYIKKRTR